MNPEHEPAGTAAAGKPKKTSRKGNALPFLTIIVVLLIAVIVLALLLVTQMNARRTEQEKAVAAIAEVESELEQTREETVPLETLRARGQEFGVSTEFLQSFFDDVFVYWGEDGTIVYDPVDPSLPRNNYDWANLTRENGRIGYVQDGQPAKVGIDVSKHQGEINWSKVKADGVDYAIIRAGYRGYGTGKVLLDETFEQNIKGASGVGLPIGVYFYSQAVTVPEALEEAAMIIEAIQGYDIDYPVVFDTEQVGVAEARADQLDADTRTKIAAAFCEAVKQAGYKPMIYASAKWFAADLDLSQLTQYDKWLAQYYKTPFFPYEFQMWQYTGKGKVDGIEGDVDWNISFVDYTKE